jgi:NAD(P)-dependent dehydrogenase (short-subunit alcohol dehydrogenase family)
MKIAGSTAFVTAANRGLGKVLAIELINRGARVYAGARNPESVDVPGAVAVDITDLASVAAAAESAGDVTLLINNAGISTGSSLLSGDLADARREIETNYLGPLSMIRAFAPTIERNGGGTIVNILSVLSWLSLPATGAYCASKSAEWSMTNAVRQELAPRGIRVSGLHVGYIDTDLARNVNAPKLNPVEVALAALNGIEADEYEILADDLSRNVRGGLAGGVAALYPQLP